MSPSELSRKHRAATCPKHTLLQQPAETLVAEGMPSTRSWTPLAYRAVLASPEPAPDSTATKIHLSSCSAAGLQALKDQVVYFEVAGVGRYSVLTSSIAQTTDTICSVQFSYHSYTHNHDIMYAEK